MMTRFRYLTTALSALIALSAPAAHAGSQLQGPALDGRAVALPDGLGIAGAPAEELQRRTGKRRGMSLQGPTLDGREVALPDGLRIVSAPATEEVHKLASNGPALDGRQIALPPAAARLGRVPELPRTK